MQSSGSHPIADTALSSSRWILAETSAVRDPHFHGGIPQAQPHHGDPASEVPVLSATGNDLFPNTHDGRDGV